MLGDGVGTADGADVGTTLGDDVGTADGADVGTTLGDIVGDDEGTADGSDVGRTLGDFEGFAEDRTHAVLSAFALLPGAQSLHILAFSPETELFLHLMHLTLGSGEKYPGRQSTQSGELGSLY
jgi:hypothetical protein